MELEEYTTIADRDRKPYILENMSNKDKALKVIRFVVVLTWHKLTI